MNRAAEPSKVLGQIDEFWESWYDLDAFISSFYFPSPLIRQRKEIEQHISPPLNLFTDKIYPGPKQVLLFPPLHPSSQKKTSLPMIATIPFLQVKKETVSFKNILITNRRSVVASTYVPSHRHQNNRKKGKWKIYISNQEFFGDLARGLGFYEFGIIPFTDFSVEKKNTHWCSHLLYIPLKFPSPLIATKISLLKKITKFPSHLLDYFYIICIKL